MPIIYPNSAPTSQLGNGFFNYAIGFFDLNNGFYITTGSAYTSSFEVSAYMMSVKADVASGSTIDIAVPSSSFQVETGPNGSIIVNPAIEFWRLDQNANVTVRLVTNTSSVGFTKNIITTSSFYTIPTSSYNSMVNVPSEDGKILYIMLEKSQLPDS